MTMDSWVSWETLVEALKKQADQHCRAICPHCAKGVPYHTNATHSIAGQEGRHPIWDLHWLENGGLAECWAAPIRALEGHIA